MTLTRSPTSACAILVLLVFQLLIFVDPLCDLLRTVSIFEDATINRLYTLQRLVHCIHTKKSWPRAPIRLDERHSDKTNLLHDTLPTTPTNSPLGYVMGGPGCPLWTSATFVADHHHRKTKPTVPNEIMVPYNYGHKRLCLPTGPGQCERITFPSWRHR